MVVGAQKAATTWLFECLHEHPDVFVPDLKEVHFFCPGPQCRFSRYDKGVGWYEGLFPEVGFTASGELTTDYMFYPGIAEKLYAYAPHLKIIFMLRNPVDRAYSAYWMWKRHTPDLPAFREMVDREPAFLERGLYHRQIVPFLDLFGRDRVRIYVYEEVLEDKRCFLSDLYGFIGVEPDFLPRSMTRSVGATRRYPPAIGFLLYKVASPIINLPGVIAAWRFFRRRTNIWERALELLSVGRGGQGYPELGENDREYLASHYRSENARLFDLLGREITVWAS